MSGIDDPRTPAVQPAGVVSDETDPCDPLGAIVATADCDGDGNPNGTDPNPLTPVANDDAFVAPLGTTTTYDILDNDDFLPGANTTITDLGSGSGVGVVVFDPATGEIAYTPDASEVGTVVTVDYQVCNTTVTPLVCETATITISVPNCPDPTDTDGDGLTDCEESTGVDDPSTVGVPTGITDAFNACDPIDAPNNSNLDSDGDGLTDCEETTGVDDLDTPNMPILDGDGLTSDPFNACDPLGNTDPLADADGDGLSDCEEMSGMDDPRTAAVQPAGVVSDETDPCDPLGAIVATADCDGDGNPNGTDPNPLTPVANDDAFVASLGTTTTYDILDNDDFLPGANTTITDLGSGNAVGTIVFNPMTGEIDYTPDATEIGTTVTVEYQVCHTANIPLVCETATITINVPNCPDPTDTDGDGLTDCEESTGVDDLSTVGVPTGITDAFNACDPIDAPNNSNLDSDGDGLTDCEETTGVDDLDTPNMPIQDADGLTSDPNNACDPLGNTDPLADADGDGLSDCEEMSGMDDPRTPAVQPAGVVSDETDPCDPLGAIVATADCDGDGNPNGTDPNPNTPVANDDAFVSQVGTTTTYDILENDDFLPGANTTITDLGSGSAVGTIVFDPTTGTVDYTPDPSEVGTTVTVDYQVCNAATTPLVCETATITITVTDCPNGTDTDGDGLTDCEEMTGVDDPTTVGVPDGFTDPNNACDPITAPNNSNFDSDGDGLTDCEETTGMDDPDTPNSPILDGDGLTSDPYNACDPLLNTDPTVDTDGDGLSDCEEATGIDDPRTVAVQPAGVISDETDPCDPLGVVVASADCDGDGVTNGQEVTDGTDPENPCDFNSANQIIANVTTDWNATDCDGDGVTNGDEVIDGTDVNEVCDYNPVNQVVANVTADWNNADCDGDGVTNGQEVIDGTDYNDPCDYDTGNVTVATTAMWDAMDCDGDGVTNGQEVTDGTSPLDPCDYIFGNVTLAQTAGWNDADCDGDGVTNGQEVTDGTSTSDPCDYEEAN
ncbi:MAG: hypothetical protein HF967_05360, partial [Methanosarcinales archaeon]|nr:hypothetical protein [Methanosarcinales archaeon]